MLLAIEAGNTNIKFALIDGTDIKTRWRIATDARKTADEYAVWLLQLLEIEGYTRGDVDAVICSTVVPRALHNIRQLASKYFGVEALVAGKAPVEWGIAISAQSLEPGEKIVISFGTATTFDHVGSNGAYRGGIIAPGINLSLDALVNATAKLPRIAIEAPDNTSVIGRNTEDQMLIGIYWGYVAMIEGLIARMKSEIAMPVKVIATGGLAALFQQHSHLFDRIEPDLTLRGLALLYNNKQD
jgi:type III pantothenate kinase